MFPGQPLAQLACLVSSVGPDVVMAPQFFLDKMRGKQPLLEQGPFLLAIKEMSHSLILAIASVALGLWLHQPLITAFGVGWVGHIVVDILTHGDPTFQALGDPHYIAPLGSLRKAGVWEYRIKTGQTWPVKDGEAATIVLSSELTLYFWFTLG